MLCLYPVKSSKSGSEMIPHLFFRLLPVQVGMIAMGSANSIIDGIVAARFIDSATVGVVGLYYTVLLILEGIGGLLLGGMSVLSGKYLGSGQVEKTRGVCSLSITCAFAVGAFLTAVSFIIPGRVADFLGADAGLRGPLSVYVTGYAFGILPQLLGQQFAACLQMERQDKRGHTAIILMILTNAVLDILLVCVLHMGVFGLALATSACYWVYFFVTAGYYFKKTAQLRPDIRLIDWDELPEVVKTGLPNALLVVCLAARSLVLNRLLLAYAGEDGLSALAAFNMFSGLILSTAIGTGGTVRMLSSVFIGEENREALLALMKLIFTRVMAIVAVISLAVIVLSGVLAGIFFPDRSSNVFHLTKQLYIIYGIFIPVALGGIACTNYGQAAGHRFYTNLVSVMDGFFSVVIPALILTPLLGALGMWISLAIGLCMTAVITLGYIRIRCGHWPRSAEEWLLLPESFGSRDDLVLIIREMAEVPQTSDTIQSFCEAHGVAHRTALHAGLCLEEMAGNIVTHGFTADRADHSIELRVLLRDDDVMLRIKDDCIPFNPKEWYEMTSQDDPFSNIGIRMVYKLSDDLNYQNLLGLNVLTILLKDTQAA